MQGAGLIVSEGHGRGVTDASACDDQGACLDVRDTGVVVIAVEGQDARTRFGHTRRRGDNGGHRQALARAVLDKDQLADGGAEDAA